MAEQHTHYPTQRVDRWMKNGQRAIKLNDNFLTLHVVRSNRFSAPKLRGNRLGKTTLLSIDCLPGLWHEVHAFMSSYPLPEAGTL